VAASSAATISARSLPSDPSTPTTMAPPDPFENKLKIAGPRRPGRGPSGPTGVQERPGLLRATPRENGRASCRDREWPDVEISDVDVSLKKKTYVKIKYN